MKKIYFIFFNLLFVLPIFASPLEVAINELENARVRESQAIERKANSDLLKCTDLKCRDEVSIEKYKALNELNERAYLYLKNLVQN